MSKLWNADLIIMSAPYAYFDEIYSQIKDQCSDVLHPKFIDDQRGIILTTSKTSMGEFKEYLKTNIEKLGLKNDKSTQIAILNAHGTEKGAAERNYDIWGPHSFMEEYEWTKDGVENKYEGFKNDKHTNKMKFEII